MYTQQLEALKSSNFNKTTAAYGLVKHLLENPTATVRPCYTSGSGKRIKNNDHTYATRNILDTLKVPYEFGNDAPKGGLTGNFIKLKN